MGLRRKIESRLPFALRREIIRRRYPHRKFETVDMQAHEAGADVVVESYWLVTPIDEGPALSVRVLGEECWRVDLLHNRPHLHLNIVDARARRSPHSSSLHLASGNLEEAMSLLRSNVSLPLASSGRRAVRTTELDRPRLDRALDAAHVHLEGLIAARAPG